jgi:uncharacterized protein YuzE
MGGALSLMYDPDAEALYLTLREGLAAETIEIQEAVYVDLDAEGRPLGVEFLDPGDLVGFLTRRGGEFILPECITEPLAPASS